MTLFIYVNGVDLSDRVRLEDGLQTISTHADGTFAESGLKFDDPLGNLTIQQWSQVIINETACAQPRLYTGYVEMVTIERGPYKTGPGRVLVCEIADLNVLLGNHSLVFTQASAKRPLETGNQRLTWLLASPQMARVHDNGFVASIGANYGEADYRGQYPDSPLQDLCATSSTDKIFFVYWDPVAAQASLFLDVPSAAVNNCTLKISNTASDVDSTTVFAPDPAAALAQDASEMYDGVMVVWQGGQNYYTDYDGRFPGGFHRDGVQESPRLGTLATVGPHAQFYLDAHATPIDTIKCRVLLPREKVTLIEAGMRIQIKFTHLDNFYTSYSSYTYARIQERTVDLVPGTNELYNVDLTLSTRGIPPSGGGTGTFPATPPASADVVQHKYVYLAAGGTNNITLDHAPTAGNVLVLGIQRGGGLPTLHTGWTASPDGGYGGTGFFNDYGRTAYRTVAGGETATIQVRAAADNGLAEDFFVVEITGVGTTPTANSEIQDGSTTTTPSSVSAGSLTVPGAGIAVGFITVQVSNWVSGGNSNINTVSPWVQAEQKAITTGVDHPLGWLGTRKTTTSGSVSTVQSLNGSIYNYGGYGGQTLFFPASTTSEPPAQGKPFGPITPVETPNGATYTFTLPTGYEFADNSLQVFVDRLDQTAAVTSYDGAARTFTLSFAPWGTDVIEVYAVGR